LFLKGIPRSIKKSHLELRLVKKVQREHLMARKQPFPKVLSGLIGDFGECEDFRSSVATKMAQSFVNPRSLGEISFD
jgi:hypothetical protein